MPPPDSQTFLKESEPAPLYLGLTQLPSQAYRRLKNVYHGVKRWSYPERISFDEAFPNVDKAFVHPQKAVATPEVPQMSIRSEDVCHEYLLQDEYVIPEDFVTVLCDVLYCPRNNVILTDGRQVVDESVNAPPLYHDFPEEVRKLSGYFALLRSCQEAFYHVLLENSLRLLSINRSPYRDLDDIKVLCPGTPTPTENHFLSKLAPANAAVCSPEKRYLYQLEKLIFTPFKTRRLAGYIPEDYVERFRAHLFPNRLSKRDQRLFISRERTSQRRVKNREELMNALKKRGFTKVLAEDLSPREQVELFYDAEALVGAHGSGLANMMFGRDLKAVELNPTRSVMPHFYYVSQSLDHTHGQWCGNGVRRWSPAFEVEVAGVLKLLDQMGVH